MILNQNLFKLFFHKLFYLLGFVTIIILFAEFDQNWFITLFKLLNNTNNDADSF